METELNDTIEWLSKRIFIGKRDEEYIRFAIKEYASKYHETELKKLRVTDVSGRSELLKCDICDSTYICSHSEGFICNDCNNVMTAF